MVEKHQHKWLDQLPFVLLGKRVTLQPDIGASPCELAMGMNVRIPGQILRSPGDIPSDQELRELLGQVRSNTANPPMPTSNHSKPEDKLPDIPSNVTHVYTRQHKATGLQCPYEGPFPIVERPSRSTVKIDVGSYKSGERRYEIRHFNDLKLAHPDSLAAPAARPKLGRPSKTTVQPDGQVTTDDRVQTEGSPSPQNRFPNPTVGADDVTGSSSKQAVLPPVGTSKQSNHATSSANEEFQGVITGPPPAQAFGGRPVRATRNPNPSYIDSLWLASAINLAGNK